MTSRPFVTESDGLTGPGLVPNPDPRHFWLALADQVKFGGGWAVAIGLKVKADPFDAVQEKVALLGVEGDAPFVKM